jgi:N-acetylglucosaminyldiphosphoundecaprenol N-acetyl-beta-D-mannosaminyltransferase
MKRPGIALFGITINKLRAGDAVQKCMDLLREASSEKKVYHVTTLDTKGLTQVHGWFCHQVRDPELLTISRKASLTLISEKSLGWLCACLGSSMPDPITPEELLLKLCRELGMREKGVFFLGGDEKIIKSAAIKLHEASHGLRLVGIATPAIYDEGEDLENARARDSLLVEQINASSADVLLVNLGSPKQERWFERVRKDLKVPLVFTANDAFDKIYPEDFKKQKKDAIRKWLGKGVSAVKMVWMAIPLVIYHNINRLVFKLLHAKRHLAEPVKSSQLFLSPSRTIALIPLPPLLDAGNVAALALQFEEAASHDGFRFLIEAWKYRFARGKEIYGFCPNRDVAWLMKVHRCWNFFKYRICFSADELMSRLALGANKPSFYHTIYQQKDLVVVSLFGALDTTINYDVYLQKLMPIIEQKNCAFDFSYCTSVDNTGISVLLSLRKLIEGSGKKMTVCSLNPKVKQQLRLARVDHFFPIIRCVSLLKQP